MGTEGLPFREMAARDRAGEIEDRSADGPPRVFHPVGLDRAPVKPVDGEERSAVQTIVPVDLDQITPHADNRTFLVDDVSDDLGRTAASALGLAVPHGDESVAMIDDELARPAVSLAAQFGPAGRVSGGVPVSA